jgi:IS5 family transposase
MTYTPGNVHDSKEFDKLLGINKHKNKIKTCGEVYADSAYAKVLSHSLGVTTP